MKTIALLICTLVLLAQTIFAWRPSGWIYMDWPWAFEDNSGDWYWFNTADQQWVYGYSPVSEWSLIGESELRDGWTYWTEPYTYGQNAGAWYWINIVDTQWACNMRTGLWTILNKGLINHNNLLPWNGFALLNNQWGAVKHPTMVGSNDSRSPSIPQTIGVVPQTIGVMRIRRNRQSTCMRQSTRMQLSQYIWSSSSYQRTSD